MAWDYRKYGAIDDPIHKSDLNSITGDYGCLQAFKRNKDLVADGGRRDSDTECNGRMVAGTATHECVARALSNRGVREKMLRGTWEVRAEQCRKVWDEEFAQEAAGRQVHWYDHDADDVGADHGLMLAGLLNDVRNQIGDVKFLEAGFIVKIGNYWCSGHADLTYITRSGQGYGLADWKTGVQRPAQIELDHSWESGIYSAAMRQGLWIDRAHVELPHGTVNKYMREREALEAELIRVAKAYETDGVVEPHVHILGEFPREIRYVHLRDYIPYEKAGKKTVSRPEELAFYGQPESGSVKFVKGDRRGPGWYHVRRTEQDIPRLENLLRNVVGTVRMGRFFESVGEKCTRCLHRDPCLNSGYLRESEHAVLEKRLRQVEIEDDGLGDVAQR